MYLVLKVVIYLLQSSGSVKDGIVILTFILNPAIITSIICGDMTWLFNTVTVTKRFENHTIHCMCRSKRHRDTRTLETLAILTIVCVKVTITTYFTASGITTFNSWLSHQTIPITPNYLFLLHYKA